MIALSAAQLRLLKPLIGPAVINTYMSDTSTIVSFLISLLKSVFILPVLDTLLPL